eukprot:COSAG01_NODE_7740_length_3077_cov_5.620215_2_plen_214_part_00
MSPAGLGHYRQRPRRSQTSSPAPARHVQHTAVYQYPLRQHTARCLLRDWYPRGEKMTESYQAGFGVLGSYPRWNGAWPPWWYPCASKAVSRVRRTSSGIHSRPFARTLHTHTQERQDERTAAPLHNRTAAQPHRRTAAPLHCHTAALPHRRTATQAHRHTAAPPHSRTAKQPHRHTAAPLHSRPLPSTPTSRTPSSRLLHHMHPAHSPPHTTA